jgi:hypothetical protein
MFRVGDLYYLLRYRGNRAKSHLISTFEYRGPVTDQPGMHLFLSTSPAADSVILEEAQLGMMKTFEQLKEVLDADKLHSLAKAGPQRS